MSRLAPHLSLPTSDLPQQLDEEGYQLDEDKKLVFVDVDVEGEEEKVSQKVGPFLNVADSLVLLQSLRQTRALYLSTLLPLFQTRSKVRAQPSPPPAPHTQIPLGRCTLQIGPCTFPDTRIFEVRYTAPEDVAEARKEADERARLQALEAKKLNPLKAKGTATSSMGTPKPTSNANITPELIAAVNAAAATDPSLQNILTLAAGGKATTAQLQFLGGVINSLQKKGLEKGGAAASPGGKNVASSSTPGKLVATGSPSPAGLAANSPLAGPPSRASGPAGHPGGPPRRPLHPPAPELPLPSPSSYLPSSTHPAPSSTTAASAPGSPSPSKASSSHQASPPPPSNAVASSSSNQPPTLLGPRPSRLRIPHDIIIEFEENKTDRFLLPLYRCLVSRDPLIAPSSSSSHHHHQNTLDREDDDDEASTGADPTLLPQSAQSTIRLSFFLPLNQSIVPPILQTSSSSSKLNPTTSETPTTARPVVRPPRPYIQPPPLPTSQETPENTSIGSGRARAAREKAAATAWDAAEVQRVQAEQAALNLWVEGERKRKEEREEKRKAASREPSARRKRGEGEGGEAGGGWPTTVVMDRCSEVVWESVKRNWERYLDVGTGAWTTEEGLEMKRREFEELLETVPPRTYLHPRHLPPLPPALIEASSDKYTLKPYVPNIKSVARVEKDSGDGEKRRVSRKRKVDAASAATEEVEVKEKEVVVKPKRVRAKRVKKEESVGAGAGAKTQSPAPPPPASTAPLPTPTPTPTPASILAQAHAQPSSSATKRKNYAYVLIDDAPTNQASSSSHPHAHAASHGTTSSSSFWGVDEEPSASGGVRRDDEFEFVVDQDGDGDVDMGGEGEGTVEREGKRSRMKPKDWEAEMS